MARKAPQSYLAAGGGPEARGRKTRTQPCLCKHEIVSYSTLR
jgi:hypothetical protein